ncbi:MBL fold metallo-hydrolase [Ideonella sp. BN130291]|uniref:MBL fold metallo-hydrolase n=1 Tax=Ideonella sp. BN130291 TaxID=3112940 RepID=UPI002E26746D|nr:MBL fold metallo-hydrolase [Ideonella sp. BN130291]
MQTSVRRLSAAASLVLTLCACAHAPVPLPAVAPGVSWLAGRFEPGEQPDGNSVVFEAPDGLIIFDTGRSAAHAERLVAAVKADGRPLKAIVNSHWHLDHIGGNASLKAAFGSPPVLASGAIEAARTGFLANYRRQIDERLATLPSEAVERHALGHELEIMDARAASTPDVTVDATQTRGIAGGPFVVGLARQAVTAGDVWLYQPHARVLASGDLVTLPAPLFDTACPAQWQQVLDRLAELDFEWLVPGHGAPMRRAGFDTYRQAYGRLLQCAASDATPQHCVDGWIADARTLFPPQDDKLARGLLGYYLENHLRGPKAQQAFQRLGCPAA